MQMTSTIKKAMATSIKLHGSQNRMDGFPYVTHPILVAMILINHTDNEDLICAALLHDTIEDTDYTAEELEMTSSPHSLQSYGVSFCSATHENSAVISTPFSISFCFWIYFLIIFSLRPTVETKYPALHILPSS